MGERTVKAPRVGSVRLAESNFKDARSKFRSAIQIYRDLADSSSVAANLHNIGVVDLRQGQFRNALSKLKEALLINRAIEDRASVAKNLAEIGAVHRKRGHYGAAIERYTMSLRISQDLDRPADIAVAQQGLGLTRLSAGDFSAADSLLQAAVEITEDLVRTATGDDRRDFLAKEMTRFHALATTRVRAGRIDEAIRSYERSRARLLTERLSGRPDSTLSIPPVDSLQQTMGGGEAAVMYANTDTERPILALVVTSDSTFAREIPDGATLERLSDRFEAGLDRLRVREEIRWSSAPGSSVLRQAKGLPMGAEAEGTLADLVRLYHYNVSVPARRQVLSAERTELLGHFLYELLVGPLEAELASADELVIVPDGALSYLPFGALSGWDGRRLVQRWRVRYVQSLRVLRLLQERDTDVPSSGDVDVGQREVSDGACDVPEQADVVRSGTSDGEAVDGVALSVERPAERGSGVPDGIEAGAAVPGRRPGRVDVVTQNEVRARRVLHRL